MQFYFVINTRVDDGLLIENAYQKQYRYKYILLNKWNEQQIHNTRGLLDQARTKPDEWIGNIRWEGLVTYGANKNKSSCEKEKNVTLIYQKHKSIYF
ncbi:hypothetical protein A6V39_04125 [Candidatus Mycoplasma haematobovis]|uniref:Uncharacterized protein n=1 Tax=Candidatus Mycoplasma haematobovis TaxID=432608 RepID=A0A1A9QDP3_9MOLU|nr:hypothetical protein [Candidatus Mycoplasma haematobovis]OAL10076.1 hypothetical protein A6V39_04125 [Candidatus Mycoplasma haematobovis]